MGRVEDSYRAFAAAHGLAPASPVGVEPLTPLLAKGGTLNPVLRGALPDPQNPNDLLVRW